MTALTDAQFYVPLKTTLVPTNGAGTPTFTRATTKNIFDNEGKLITVKSGAVTLGGARNVTNWLEYTDDLSNAAWIKSGTAVLTSGVTDPDSGSKAYQLDLPAVNDSIKQTILDLRFVGHVINLSIYIKADVAGTIRFLEGNSGAPDSTKNITTNWQRIELSGAFAGSGYPQFYLGRTSAGMLNRVYIWHPQFEDVTGQAIQTASDYISVGALSAPFHGAGADGVKYFDTDIDGSPITDSTLLGLHIDPESKTNNLLWCRDLTNAGWVKTNITAEKTQMGIDAVTNSCSLLTASSANATVLRTITAASTPACSGFWVKRSVGTGSVFFTRNGGVDWLDITSLINSSTFTCVKIENTSVTNPQVGFKIASSGDAIIVDAGLNHAGTTLTLPIFTTSAAVTRSADVLTYQTASNFSDTAGTILAKVNKSNWGLEVGSVVGDTTGLHIGTTGGISVDAKDGTNTISTTITQTNGSSGNIGMVWSGSTLKSFGNTDFGTPGSYDGSMNLSAIKIMSGASGYIRDVAIWLSALSDIEFKSAIGIITNLPLNIKKNVNSSCILLLNQAGIYSINSASIISTITKKINTTSGSNIVTIASGYDNVGLVIGGKVVNADLSINTTVTAINGRNITLNSNVSFTQSNESVTFDTEVVSPTSLISISNANFSIPAGSSIKLMRNGSLIYTFYNTSKWSLNELSQQFLGDDEITVEVPTGALVEFKLNKFGNWGNSNSSYGNI